MPETILRKQEAPLKALSRSSLVVLFVFALAFRIVYILQSTDNPLFGVPWVDAFVYNAWANDMVHDKDFERVSIETLQFRRMSVSDNGIILLCARQVAAEYLARMQDEVGEQARAHLLAAAGHLRRESETMGAAHSAMPWGNVSGEELARRFEPANRQHLANVIRECREHFTQAIAEIQEALQTKGV